MLTHRIASPCFTDCSRSAGWSNAVHDSVPILVAQRCRYFLALSPRPSVRASLCSAPDLVRPPSPDSHVRSFFFRSADLEITVSLLIQIDKLVQLLESPVFTCQLLSSAARLVADCRPTALRLQLLEPDRYPYLLKAMYGLLMLLPQSSAFATLRNRLSAVSQLGFLHIAPKPFVVISHSLRHQLTRWQYRSTYAASTTRSTVRRDDIRWAELLTFFRQVQMRHERSRRSSSAAQSSPFESSELMNGSASNSVNNVAPSRTTSAAAQALRKKIPTGGRRSEPNIGNPLLRGVSGSSAQSSSPSILLKRRLGGKP